MSNWALSVLGAHYSCKVKERFRLPQGPLMSKFLEANTGDLLLMFNEKTLLYNIGYILNVKNETCLIKWNDGLLNIMVYPIQLFSAELIRVKKC